MSGCCEHDVDASGAGSRADAAWRRALWIALGVNDGKITATNAAKGTVMLDRQAIPEVKWDAMSIGLTVTDPAMLKELKVGDMVVFDLRSAAEPLKISWIKKQ